MAVQATSPDSITDISTLFSALAPSLIGSGKTTVTAGGPTAPADLQNIVNAAMGNASNPDVTNQLVNNILINAANAFAPVMGQANKAGIYNSSTLQMLSAYAQASATAQASQAVLNFQTSQEQIAQAAAGDLINTQKTSVTAPNASLIQALPTLAESVGGAVLGKTITNKLFSNSASNSGGTNPATTPSPSIFSRLFGSNSSSPGTAGQATAATGPTEIDASSAIGNAAPTTITVPNGSNIAAALSGTTGTTDTVGTAGSTAIGAESTGTTATAGGVLDTGAAETTGTTTALDTTGIGAETAITPAADSVAAAITGGATTDAAVAGGDAAAGGLAAGATGPTEIAGADAAAGSEGAVGASGGGSGALGAAGGIAAGGAIGGLIGNQFGKGTGNEIATGVGAAAGLAVGADLTGTLAAIAPALAWIVCTELHRQKRMPSRFYYGGAKTFTNYWEYGKRGYYLWAIPSVRHLRKHPNSLYSKFLEAIFNWRAENIAASNGVKGARKLLKGAVITAILWPLCALLAVAVCPFLQPPNWQALYKEELETR